MRDVLYRVSVSLNLSRFRFFGLIFRILCFFSSQWNFKFLTVHFPVLSHARVGVDFWRMETSSAKEAIAFSSDEMIRQADMLNVMNQRDGNGDFVPFGQITYVKLDNRRNTGGEKVTLENAVLHGNGKSKSTAKNPNHFENYTRNIKAAGGDRIMKIHVPLITRFNGLKVIL